VKLDTTKTKTMIGSDKPHCIRTGMCCQRLMLPKSPRQLRESYEMMRLLRSDKDAVFLDRSADIPPFKLKMGTPIYRDIELIYPMLAGRCQGKVKLEHRSDAIVIADDGSEVRPKDPDDALVIDEETFEDLEDERKAHDVFYVYGPCRFFDAGNPSSLVISETRHGCSIHDHKPWMCSSYPNNRAGWFRGCGYNAGKPNAGIAFAAFNTLLPLDEEEK